MAEEIRIERKQRSMLPWILALVLLALAIGLALALGSHDLDRVDDVREVGDVQEAPDDQKKRDETPRHLQQWVSFQADAGADAA